MTVKLRVDEFNEIRRAKHGKYQTLEKCINAAVVILSI